MEPLQIINLAFGPGWGLNMGVIARRVRSDLEVEDFTELGMGAVLHHADRLPKRKSRVVLHALRRELYPTVGSSDVVVDVADECDLREIGISKRAAYRRSAAVGRPLVLLPRRWGRASAETDERFDALITDAIDSWRALHTAR